MRLFRLPILAALVQAATQAFAGPADDLSLGLAGSHPLPRWSGLQHRGQPPARGILGGHVDPARLGKGPSRRDKHRAMARELRSSTAEYSRDVQQPRNDLLAREARACAGMLRIAGWFACEQA